MNNDDVILKNAAFDTAIAQSVVTQINLAIFFLHLMDVNHRK